MTLFFPYSPLPSQYRYDVRRYAMGTRRALNCNGRFKRISLLANMKVSTENVFSVNIMWSRSICFKYIVCVVVVSTLWCEYETTFSIHWSKQLSRYVRHQEKKNVGDEVITLKRMGENEREREKNRRKKNFAPRSIELF